MEKDSLIHYNRWNWGESVIIIINGGEGMVEIQFEEGWENGYICNLSVIPDKRNKGLGTRLLKEAEKVILDKGRNVATLYVEEDKEWLIKWYLDSGYKVYSRWEEKKYLCFEKYLKKGVQ